MSIGSICCLVLHEHVTVKDCTIRHPSSTFSEGQCCLFVVATNIRLLEPLVFLWHPQPNYSTVITSFLAPLISKARKCFVSFDPKWRRSFMRHHEFWSLSTPHAMQTHTLINRLIRSHPSSSRPTAAIRNSHSRYTLNCTPPIAIPDRESTEEWIHYDRFPLPYWNIMRTQQLYHRFAKV